MSYAASGLRASLVPFVRLEPSSLHPIAAHLLVAPTARVILAAVQEQPAAFRIAAFPQAIHRVRSREFRRDQREHPQRKLRALHRSPVPLQTRVFPSQLLLRPRGLEISSQGFDG